MASNWSTTPSTPAPTSPIAPRSGAPRIVGSDLIQPPVALLLLASACVVATFGLFASDTTMANGLGYVTGCVGTISFVMFYRLVDQGRRQEPTYSPNSTYEVLAILLLTSGLLSSVVHLWLLATELSK